MKKLNVKNISSLEKVFPVMGSSETEFNQASTLIDEEFSYQVIVKGDWNIHGSEELEVRVCSEIADYVKVYNIGYVPVTFPSYPEEYDNDFISHHPGVFPDVLLPEANYIMVKSYSYTALWVSVRLDEKVPAGIYNIKLVFGDKENVLGESTFKLELIGARLPKSDIPVTQWLHPDCIATYHGCEMYSDKHWELIDKYMVLASEHGLNMILTPIFTLPLDTKIGAERPTFQLVEVEYKDGKYTFDFANLEKWLRLCRKNNFQYIELSHLYSQWGAGHTPKVVVTENGKKIKKFGWHTDSMSEEYKSFIIQLVPRLKKFLAENWDIDKVYFHISDEPSAADIEHYGEIYNFIKPLFGEVKQMDAISNYELCKLNYIENPVVAMVSINNFLENGIEDMWVYYCCGEGKNNLSNRFIAMPSYRNRIIGAQLYKFSIKGFLQWGYNFYYSHHSTHPVNPYINNDGDGLFPAGDAFSVYPVNEGAVPSLRLKVFNEALQDMMAFKLLEKYVGRDAVLKILDKDGTLDFNTYSRNSRDVLINREKVNQMIKENL